jgi:hypothetical protein
MKPRALSIIIALAVTAMPGRAGEVDVRQAVTTTQRYLAKWEATLIALVADEQYQQEVTGLRGWGGATRGTRDARRRLTSEVLLVRAPADNAWLSFRDVMAVDGAAVHDRQRRFDDLFAGPVANIFSSANLIGQEGARYNLGPFRTINTPTAPLVFLTNPYAASTEWKLEGARLEGRRAWLLRYIQRKPPFAVNTFGKRTDPLTGRFWVEPETGRILQGELVVKGGGIAAKVLIKYAQVKTIASWAPIRMEESYESSGQIVKGIATYSNHRLFRTAARILPPS